jgi:hypothetical protein
MILPGSRVLAFDSRLYRDDVSTPSAVTIMLATVVRRYGKMRLRLTEDCILGPYPDLVDLLFDHNPRVSHGHFTDGIEEIR